MSSAAGLDTAELGAAAGELGRLSPRLADLLGVAAEPRAEAAEAARFRLFEAVVSVLEHGAAPRAGADRARRPPLGRPGHAPAARSTSCALRFARRGAGRRVSRERLSRTQALAGALADLRRDRMVERVALAGLEAAR